MLQKVIRRLDVERSGTQPWSTCSLMSSDSRRRVHGVPAQLGGMAHLRGEPSRATCRVVSVSADMLTEW